MFPSVIIKASIGILVDLDSAIRFFVLVSTWHWNINIIAFLHSSLSLHMHVTGNPKEVKKDRHTQLPLPFFFLHVCFCIWTHKNWKEMLSFSPYYHVCSVWCPPYIHTHSIHGGWLSPWYSDVITISSVLPFTFILHLLSPSLTHSLTYSFSHWLTLSLFQHDVVCVMAVLGATDFPSQYHYHCYCYYCYY